MSEFAIVCPDATMIIAPAINITVAVSAAPAKIALIVFGFRMVDLLTIAPINPTFPICGRPRPRKVFLQCFDQIACVHMSGLFVRSHMNAGQDGFRDESSKQMSDLIEGHWGMRNFSRHGSIDHTICSLSCKFWHQQHGCS
jgi:hypothetical protein